MTAASPHWAAQYIGVPWDPSEQHCWAFCRHVWAEQFALDVPAMPISADDLRATIRNFENNPARAGWVGVTEPQDGDAVLMAKARQDCHIGIWVAPPDALGGVLHAINPASVFTTSNRLRDIGYRITGIFRRDG